MDTETMIRELERVEEKHKHDKVFTGQLDVAQMAHDTKKRLEELKPYEDTGLTPLKIMELKEAVQKLENIFGDEITVNQVIDFFVDFYIAQGDPDRVEKAELLYVSDKRCRAVYQQYPKKEHESMDLMDKIEQLEKED